MTVEKPIATVRSIQNRLFLLLLRAFIIALAFLILFMLLITGLNLARSSQSNPLFRSAIITRLETYYISRGSWDGVNAIFTNDPNFEASQWKSSVLLDNQGDAVVEYGFPVDPRLHTGYQAPNGTTTLPILINGTMVGSLVTRQNVQPSLLFIFRFLIPVILASVILAIFASLIGLLLTRRVVHPLAKVIAATGELARGDFSARVGAKGPGDLKALSDGFDRMAEALERNDQERRNMLADITHELRTPLTVMRGRLEGIMDGIYPSDGDHVGPALEEVYLLERLVEDLRLLTLAESHQLTFEKQNVDLIEIVRCSINMFQAEADENKIDLSLETSLEKAMIFVDPLRTEQVISNLLANAMQYIPKGGKIWAKITAGTHNSQDRDDNRCELLISDNGPGIPEADIPYIFNRFWRLEKSRGRKTGGAGLGLAITKLLVAEQGGQIEARNLPEGGLQVRVSFPLAE
jgi:signal transduction histidine kinase